ncbi:MAG: hypothetical protein GXO70_09270 [Acidobacteria bacterium]|nr:hypothetical protein [Acidobacteriota bacterium]
MIDEYLKELVEALKRQQFWLKHSYDESIKIGLKDTYAVMEFDTLETLTSRFARSIDFLVRKVWRAIDEAEFESQGTLIDVVNRAHKRKLFDNEDVIQQIKEIRNDVAHEYLNERLKELFSDVVKTTPAMLDMMQRTIAYCEQLLSGE